MTWDKFAFGGIIQSLKSFSEENDTYEKFLKLFQFFISEGFSSLLHWSCEADTISTELQNRKFSILGQRGFCGGYA